MANATQRTVNTMSKCKDHETIGRFVQKIETTSDPIADTIPKVQNCCICPELYPNVVLSVFLFLCICLLAHVDPFQISFGRFASVCYHCMTTVKFCHTRTLIFLLCLIFVFIICFISLQSFYLFLAILPSFLLTSWLFSSWICLSGTKSGAL